MKKLFQIQTKPIFSRSGMYHAGKNKANILICRICLCMSAGKQVVKADKGLQKAAKK
jgi:hypothetical protein